MIMINRYVITSRYKSNPLSVADINDFTLKKSELININDCLLEYDIILYCIDFVNKELIFTHTRNTIEVSRCSFIYMMQFEEAEYISRLPINDIDSYINYYRLYEKYLFIFTTGGSGSTLIKNIYAQDDDNICISEPDFVSQMVIMKDIYDDNEIKDLIYDCMKILYISSKEVHKNIIIKFRSYCIELSKSFIDIYPESIILFSYREPIKQIASVLSMYKSINSDWLIFRNELELMHTELKKMIHTMTRIPDSFLDFALYSWISVIESYIEITRLHKNVYSIDYMFLIEKPEMAISKLFLLLNKRIEVKSLEIMNDDSRSNTILNRDNINKNHRYIISDADIERINMTISHHKTIKLIYLNLSNSVIDLI